MNHFWRLLPRLHHYHLTGSTRPTFPLQSISFLPKLTSTYSRTLFLSLDDIQRRDRSASFFITRSPSNHALSKLLPLFTAASPARFSSSIPPRNQDGSSEEKLQKKTSTPSSSTVDDEKSSQPVMTNWEKFKDMYKKYWYVLIPVHGVLCCLFMVVLYYLVKSGLDVVPLLEKLGLPEKIIAPVRKSGASAYVAAAYAIYHLISPIRYAVTLAFTTLAITYLKRVGYIKPVPSSQKIKQMYDEGRDKARVLSRRLSGRKQTGNQKSTKQDK